MLRRRAWSAAPNSSAARVASVAATNAHGHRDFLSAAAANAAEDRDEEARLAATFMRLRASFPSLSAAVRSGALVLSHVVDGARVPLSVESIAAIESSRAGFSNWRLVLVTSNVTFFGDSDDETAQGPLLCPAPVYLLSHVPSLRRAASATATANAAAVAAATAVRGRVQSAHVAAALAAVPVTSEDEALDSAFVESVSVPNSSSSAPARPRRRAPVVPVGAARGAGAASGAAGPAAPAPGLALAPAAPAPVEESEESVDEDADNVCCVWLEQSWYDAALPVLERLSAADRIFFLGIGCPRTVFVVVREHLRQRNTTVAAAATAPPDAAVLALVRRVVAETVVPAHCARAAAAAVIECTMHTARWLATAAAGGAAAADDVSVAAGAGAAGAGAAAVSPAAIADAVAVAAAAAAAAPARRSARASARATEEAAQAAALAAAEAARAETRRVMAWRLANMGSRASVASAQLGQRVAPVTGDVGQLYYPGSGGAAAEVIPRV